MPKKTEELNDEEYNPNDPEARRIREDAVAYAERVANGEEPWKDAPDADSDAPRSESESVDTAAPAETATDK